MSSGTAWIAIIAARATSSSGCARADSTASAGATSGAVIRGMSWGVHRDWAVYQGEANRRLGDLEFYSVIERPDLADRYRKRVRAGVGS